MKGSTDILERIEFEESDERNLCDAEKTVKAEHEAKGNNKKDVSAFKYGDAEEKTQRS